VTTPYRTDIDALRDRRDSLAKELAELEAKTSELSALNARRAELAGELAGVEARLGAGGQGKRKLPTLDQVRVASPCNASWDDMMGDERVRFCLSCEKNVYNLSAMTSTEAEALIEARSGGEICVRYYRRKDGTLMTQDCPVGARQKRTKKLLLAVAGAGAMAAAAVTAFSRTTCAPYDSPYDGVVQGAMPIPDEYEMGEVAEPLTPPVMEEPLVPPPVDPTSQTPHVPKKPERGLVMGRIPMPRDEGPTPR
jgi:hypothetical protein